MALPKRLNEHKQDADTLISLIQDQKDKLGDDHVLFANVPNLISNYQSMQTEILDGAENLEISQEDDADRSELWSNLLDFAGRLKQYYKFSTSEGDVPEWLYYKPQASETGIEFFQSLFDHISNDLDQTFKDSFDQASSITIGQGQTWFEDWKSSIKGQDWDIYMNKVRQMSRFLHLLKGSARMTGLTRFEVKVNLYENEQQEE